MPIDDDGGRYGASLAFSPNPAGASELLVGAPFARGGLGAVHRVGRSGELFGSMYSPVLGRGTQFGASITACADWDGDAIPELVVGAPSECCGGALYVVLHARDAHVRLEGSELGLPSNARFGWSLAVLQDGGPVVAVGATGLDDSAGGCNWFGLTTPAGPPHSRRRPHHRGCPSSRLAPRSPAPPLRSGRLRRVRRRRSLSPPLPPAADLTACVRTPCRRRTRSSQRQPSPCT